MTLIDDIKRDREAGTPGPWEMGSSDGRVLSHWDGIGYWEIASASVTQFRGESGREYSAGGDQDANARRIARVPDLEAALLAADELADAIDRDNPRAIGFALAAYRKATGDSE